MSVSTNVKEGASGADIAVATRVDGDGNKVQLFDVAPVPAASDVALASTASSQTLLVENIDRRGLILNNTDANVAYLHYGATASLAAFTASIPPVASNGTPGYWEMPQPIYTGEISVIWGGNGAGSLIGSEL